MEKLIKTETLRSFLKNNQNTEFEKYLVQEGVKQILLENKPYPRLHMINYLIDLGVIDECVFKKMSGNTEKFQLREELMRFSAYCKRCGGSSWHDIPESAINQYLSEIDMK